MISLQNERFSNLNSSTVAVKFYDIICAARSGRDCSVTSDHARDSNYNYNGFLNCSLLPVGYRLLRT